MKQILLAFRTVFQRKFTVVLLALFMLGLVGGGSVLLRPASAYAASSCRYYTVKAGDTLSYIGQAYHSTVQNIAMVNHIANINLIFPGETFCIPTSRQTPPVTTTPTKSATGPTSQPTGSVATMIAQVFGSNAPQALQIAQCESGLNPNAYNPISIGGSHAAGVFQILYPSTWSGTPQAASSPYNAAANIQAAHAIFVRDGYSWREWTCQ
jgi:LysM repeat protein